MVLHYKDARIKKVGNTVLYKLVFEDEEGKQYSWMPKWKDFTIEFYRGFLVQLQNSCALMQKAIEEGDKNHAKRLLHKIARDFSPFSFIGWALSDEFREGEQLNVCPRSFEKAILEGVLPTFPMVEEAMDR